MREITSGGGSGKIGCGFGFSDLRKVRATRWKRLRGIASLLCVAVLSATCEKGPTEPIVDPPAVGSIQVSLNATGSPPEPNGCSVSVDDGEPHSIDYGGAVMFTGLEVGSHVVALSNIPANCSATNENPHSVSVNQNQTTHTGFSVACEGDQAQEPEPYLAVDKIAVGVPLGGWETFKVTALDLEGQDDDWDVSSPDPAIVEAVKVPPDQITLTGVAAGQVEVTVTSAAGLSRNVVVVVYEPMVLAVNAGELLIKYAYTFEQRLYTGATDPTYEIGGTDFWHPLTEAGQGWYALGSLGLGPHVYYRTHKETGNELQVDERHWMIVVKDNSGSALAEPESFTMEYHWCDERGLDLWNNPEGDYCGSFWTPQCPAGYVALGTVVTTDTMPDAGDWENAWVEPSTEDVRCVREGLTAVGVPVTGDYGFYFDKADDPSMPVGSRMALADDEIGRNASGDWVYPPVVTYRYGRGSFRAWRVTTPDWDDPLDANAYLETGTFVAIGDGKNDGGSTGCRDGAPAPGAEQEGDYVCTSVRCYTEHPPVGSCYDPQVTVDNEMARVLAVELPLLVDRDKDALPSLRGFDEPPDATEPTVGKAMRVPFTLLLRGVGGQPTGIYDEREDYLLNSPFLVLEKVQQYRLFEDWFRVNTGAAYSDDNITYITGTSTTQTTSMSHTAGVSLSIETGVGFLGSGTKVTANASYEFGYEKTSSREVFEQREVSFSFHCPAYHACACWSGYTRLIVSKLMPSGGLRDIAIVPYRSGYRYTATYPFEQP